MLDIRFVARAVRELWLKGRDGEGCIPGGSADVLVKLMEWGMAVRDYDLKDALIKLAEMSCFSLEQETGAERVKLHGNYSICDINWQVLSRYELFGETK